MTVGNYVTASSGPLTTINSFEPMYVTFPLDAKDYADLVRIDKSADVKRKVEFIFSTGRKYELEGVQDFYDNKIDETTGTITLRATFPNPDNQLIQGDYGRIIIYSNAKDDIPVVPQSATQENQEGRYIYILDEQGLPRMVYIKTMGQTSDGMWLVSEGVQMGDKLVTSGLQKIVPGKPVRIIESDTSKQTKEEKRPNILTRLINKIKSLKN